MRISLGAYVYATLVAGVAAVAVELTTLEAADTAQIVRPSAAREIPPLRPPRPPQMPVDRTADRAPAPTGSAAETARDTPITAGHAAQTAPVETTAPAPQAAGPSAPAVELALELDEQTPPLTSVLALSVADSLLTEPYAIGTERRTVTVASGDTLLAVLANNGAPRTQAHALVDALEVLYDPRDLQIGQELTLILDRMGHETTLRGFEIMPDVEATIRVTRNAQDTAYQAERIATHLEVQRIAAAGAITSSLAADTGTAGVPYAVLMPLIRAYSYTVDFQRDIRDGDRFEVLFEREYFDDGRVARDGEVLYARLQLGDRDLPVYRFETSDGYIDYFDRDGLSVRRALLRTPIDGARLSSGYGYRRHPILGYTRLHRGVDFAAPTGTPIFAAGDGVIERLGPNAGYGNYIRIRHTGRLGTAYAHMSRFARGLAPGARVRQGQVIGHVGSTGLSTGPHLHYEVLQDGVQVNPLSVDLPIGRELTGSDLVAFRARMDDIDASFRSAIRTQGQLAETPSDTAPP